MIFTLIITLLLNYNQVSSQSCDKTFSASAGTISAYNVTRSRCTYKIRVQSRTRMWLKLNWMMFDVDGKMPHCYRNNVKVSIGCGSLKRPMVEFCSGKMSTLPHAIVSPDSCMEITYNRPYSAKGGGFVAIYQAYEMMAQPVKTPCNTLRTTYLKLPALIVSQGWPQDPTKSHLRSYQRCKWRIQTRDKAQKIMMTIMDLNGYRKRSWPCKSGKSILKIEGKKSITTKSKRYWRFCSYYTNEEYSASTTTEYYEMEINLRQLAGFDNGRGVAIGFVSYEDEYAKSLSSWSSIIGTVAVALIAIIVALCCYRRYRRRQMMENQPMLGQGFVVQPVPVGQPRQPLPPSAYPTQPIPSAYPDQAPPPYQPPPYPGQGVPSAYPAYPPPGGPPPQGYPGYPPQQVAAPYPQQTPAPYPQQAHAPYPQQAPAPYPTAYPSAYPPPYPDHNAPPK